MGCQKSKQKVPTASADAVTTTTTSFDAIHPPQRIVQNFLLIWLDASINQSKQDCHNILTPLRSVVDDVKIFIQPNQCIQFLNGIENEKAFIIISRLLGQHLVPDIHALPQLDAIYIVCGNKSRHEQWTKEWAKIKSSHTEIKPIYKALPLVAKQYDHDSIAVSFVTVDEGAFNANLNQLEPSFIYTKIFKEILLEMKHDEKSIKDLAIYCRKFYNSNMAELNIIHEFEQDYRSKSPIWWYTRECFGSRMLNQALRTLEADTIINMSFFIRDLHQQIEQLHQKQINSYHGKSFTVYRGQGLLKTDFEKLLKSKNGLMSFNNFLSTSKEWEVSFRFAKDALTKTNMVGILFKMTIDPSISSAPFASIREVSYFQTEEEILFSMHTVFRIGEITEIDNNSLLYQVDLQLTADNDQELRILTDRIREEVAGETGWKRLGQLLIKLSCFDKAEELYTVLLEQTSDEGDKALYYNQLGYVKYDQGDYEKAIDRFKTALEIVEKTLPANHPSLTNFYNNIAGIYDIMGEYSKALQIRQKTLPPNHPDLAISYNNIAGVYDSMGEYTKVLWFYEKALEVNQKILPLNHPLLATSYNNIGLVYNMMREYSKVLSLYEKALEILEKTLPANHPSLATSHNNIGLVYNKMGEYSKALSFYEKALEIRQKILSPNHSLLATSYGNIAAMYYSMGEFFKALSFYEKALEINQKTLPPNHPDLTASYNNTANVYNNMGEYSKALSFYEKALEINQKTLFANHPSLATSCNNIGAVYYKMGEYSKALSFYEKDLEILEKTLPANHLSLATSYSNIGNVYNNMEEYLKALSFYEKALIIRQKTLSSNHPSLATSYNNIAAVYYNMGENSKALSYFERALNISQSSLSPNHPSIKSVQKNIEIVNKKL